MYICSFLIKTATIDIKSPANHYKGAGKDTNIITSSSKLYTDNVRFCDSLFNHIDREYRANRRGMPSRVFWLFVLEYRSSFSAEFSLLCLQFLYMSLNTSPCLRSASRKCPRQIPQPLCQSPKNHC